MKNKQQSSVEWYINNLIDILGDEICNKLTIEQINKIHNLGNKAVAMHKEEMIDFAMKFMMQDRPIISFYNSTFGSSNNPSSVE